MRFEWVFAISVVMGGAAWAGGVRGRVAPPPPAGAVAYIANVPGKTFAPPPNPVVIEQRGQAFLPHVLPILRGTTVRFPNNDKVRHNVFSASGPRPFNFGIYPPGAVKEMTFDQLGVVLLLCNIHENMSGYVLVLQNPYFAAVGADGRFTFEGVPDGTYTVVLWSEGRPPRERKVTVRGETDLDFSGRE